MVKWHKIRISALFKKKKKQEAYISTIAAFQSKFWEIYAAAFFLVF